VDNASTDGAIESLALGLAGCASVVGMGRNAGFAAANNRGLSEVADCDWVALLNPDAFPAEDWLEKLLDATRRHPDYQFFACRQLMEQRPETLDGAGDSYHVSGAHWRRGHGELEEGRYAEPEEVFAPCAAAALYRRDAFREVGGFEESFFCYAEDVDLGFRLRLAGHRCLYVPDAVVHHIGSATTGRRSDFTVYHGHRNLVWAFVKNMPGFLFWLYLPQHILFNVISVLRYALRGQGRTIVKAKWDAVKGLPRVLRQRREVQALRRVSAWEIRRVMAKGLLTPYFRRNE
jgi:GT2 family glycosyltransferase